MASQTLILTASGLFTTPNPLSAVPDGALLRATNGVLDKDGVLERRRGFQTFSTTGLSVSSSARIDRLCAFNSSLVAAFDSGDVAVYSASTWSMKGSTPQPDSSNKTRFAAAANALYWTSSTGIQKLDSPTGTVVAAGGLKGLNVNLVVLTNNPTYNWLPNNTQVAYRALVVHKDASGRLIRGTPSGRLVVPNSSGTSVLTNLEVILPSGVTTSHKVQLYRSPTTPDLNTEPSDEMQLVNEVSLTSSNVLSRTVQISDITPDNMRDTALYTNQTQEGILQANEAPLLTAPGIRVGLT